MDLLLRRRMMMRRGDSDPAKMPLTFEILSDGNIGWQATGSGRSIEYSKNGGEWTRITSSTSGALIPVVAGDVLRFIGDAYPGSATNRYSRFLTSDGATFVAKGNPMSLKYGEGLTGDEPLLSTDYGNTGTYAFFHLFDSCTGLLDASGMVLPAETLLSYCYSYMFNNCGNVAEITCLATDWSANNCVAYWLKGAADTGILKVRAGVTPPSYGIPSGWTVVEV